MKTTHEALMALYQSAKDHMSDDEREDVARVLLDQAGSMARNLSETYEGIGCLVSYDGQSKTRAGHFQDSEDVFPLLWGISQQFDVIAAMVEIGDHARQRAAGK